MLSLLSLWMVQLHECTSTWSPDWAFTEHCREQRTAAWHWHSPPSTNRRNWVQVERKHTERGARCKNKKIRWKRAQLRFVVNIMKAARAREEHVVAVETEQRLNKSTIGRNEAAEAECAELLSAVHHRHASALLLSELSDIVCARSTVVSHFATSMSIQVVGSPRTNTIRHLISCTSSVPCCTSQAFCESNLNQKNVFSVKSRWSLIC